MDCEKCQELLSDFLDGTLTGDDHALLSTHLEACLMCVDMRDEIGVIVGVAHECRGGDCYAPPNEQALWLRISNIIESEQGFNQAAAALTASASTARLRSRENIWTRLLSKRWELSLPQVTAAIAAIVVTVSLVTTLGVQSLNNYQAGPPQGAASGLTPQGGVATRDALMADGYYPRAYVHQQQASINYWQQRVEQRKANWNPRMRDSFDRSIGVIDQAVTDSLEELQRNPHDEVSEEMLNSALRNKVELLREFCENYE
jgi:hypothetical protein